MFINLVYKEIKHQYKSLLFLLFGVVVILFYLTQYGLEFNRLSLPEEGDYHGYIRMTDERDIYKEAYRQIEQVIQEGYVVKYAPLYKEKKLNEDQLQEISDFFNSLISPSEVQLASDETMVEELKKVYDHMNRIDEMFSGSTVFSEDFRNFSRKMTDDEAMTEYEEIKTKDRFTRAYGRLFADYMGIVALLFVVFIGTNSVARDKKAGVSELIYSSRVKSYTYVSAKFVGLVISIMSVFVGLALIETLMFIISANQMDVIIDYFAFMYYTLYWVGPSVMVCVALAMLLSYLIGNSIVAIMIYEIIGFAVVMTGNLSGSYGWTNMIIRFNHLGNHQLYEVYKNQIFLNRLLYFGISLIFLVFATVFYNLRRSNNLRGFKK